MKKNVIFFIFITCSLVLKAQTNDTISLADFQAFYNSESKKIDQDVGNRSYGGVVSKIEGILGEYYKLSKKNINNNFWFVPNMYYNLSHFSAIQGEDTSAILYLDSAVHHGYKNFRQIKNDTVFNHLYSDNRFQKIFNNIRERGDYLYILQHSGEYKKEYNDPKVPRIDRLSKDYLEEIRTGFKLDSVTGNGDEVSRIINLLKWAHNIIPHDGNNGDKIPSGATGIYQYCKSTNKGVHCGALAEFMKECYLSLGFDAHRIICLPKDTTDFDCHSINQVFSNTLKKWIWIDPTNNAYVKDDKGNLLSIEEVRYRLKNHLPVVLNEDANWNNKSKVTKEQYIDNYMAKNLYWFRRWIKDDKSIYKAITLLPIGFTLNFMKGDLRTNDEQYFWNHR